MPLLGLSASCGPLDQQPSKIYSKQSLQGAANNEGSPQMSSAPD